MVFHPTKQLATLAVALLAATAGAQTTTNTTLSDKEQAAIDSAVNAALEKNIELKEIEVTAQRPLVKNEIDRVSYDIQADADSRTNSTLEMLKKVPLVSVDGQDEIRVKGSTNFKIYKNGHPDPSLSSNPKEVLKAIPASMIKRIEVITEPGAKYDAEGVSAILNIVMMTNADINGITGTIGAGVNHRGEPNASAYVTSQVGRWVTSVNYGYHRQGRHDEQFSSSETHYTESGNTLRSEGSGLSSVNVHYGNIDSSVEIDSLNLLSLTFGGYFFNYKSDGTGRIAMTDAAGSPIYSYTQNTHSPGNSYHNFNGRADYQHKTTRKDEALTLSYMLSTTRSTSELRNTISAAQNPPVPYTVFGQNGRENFWEHTFQFDWTRPFAQWHKMETGVKYIYRSNTSHTVTDYDSEQVPSVDSRFKHLTQVAAAYLSYTYHRDRWSARAGLRYEWSHLRASYPDGSQEGFHRSLNDWVPSASMSYQFDMANSLKMAFATRIHRPGISYLNPAVVEQPTTISYGNARLSSARSYSVSATFMHIGPKFTFNVVPGFSVSNNEIAAVQFVQDGKRVSTYANTLTERWVGLSGFLQWMVHPKTSIMVNGNVGYNYFRSRELNLKNSGWNSFFFTQITQQLPWKLRLTANVGKWGGGASGLYGKNGNNWFHGLGLQRSFLKDDRLTVRINANQPFGKKYTAFTSRTIQGDFTGWDRNEWAARSFSLSVSYRFGSLNTRVKKTDKTIENSDVVGGSTAGGGQAQNSSGPN